MSSGAEKWATQVHSFFVFLSAPVVSARDSVLNVAVSVVVSTLSVVGVNFVVSDTTPSGRMASAQCSTMAWSSSSSVVCVGTVADPLVVTVGGFVGTVTLDFSYDGYCH